MSRGGGPARTLLGAGAVVVMLTSPLPMASADIARAAPLMAGGTVLLAGVAATSSSLVRSRRWTTALLLFALFVGWSVLGTVWGMAPFHATRRLATWCCGLAVCAALAMTPDSAGELRRWVRVLVAGAAALAGYGLLRHAAGHDSAERLSSTFANADCFAALLVIGLGLSCGLLGDGKRFDTVLASISSLLVVSALALTGSRAGALGAAAVAIGMGGILLPLPDGRTRLIRIFVLPAMLLGVMAVGGGLADQGNRWLLLLQSEGQQGLAVRTMVLEGTLPTASRSPIIGAGPGNFGIAFLKSRPHGPFRGFINQAHIEAVQLLVETGLVGLLLFAAAMFLAIRGAARAAPLLGSMAAGIAAALLGVCAYGLFNFALPVPADFVWIAGVIGLACACDRLTEKKVARQGKTPRAVALTLAAAGLALFVGVTGWRTWEGERLAAQAQRLGAQLRWEEAIGALDRAIALQAGNERLYAARAEFEQRRGLYEGSDDVQARALDDMRTALRLTPDAKGLRVQAARFFRSAGLYDEAEGVLLQACQACPTDLGPRTELALFYADFGRYREAAEQLWTVLPDLPESESTLARYLINAQAVGQEGVASLQRWHAERPTDAEVRALGLRAAQSAAREGELDVASAFYAALGGWDAEDLCTRVGQAALESARGRRAAARDILEPALRQVSGSPDCVDEAFLALADLYLADREAAKAVALMEKYVERAPSSVDARLRLADAYLAAQRPEAAVEALQEALQRDPDNARLQGRLHELYQRR